MRDLQEQEYEAKLKTMEAKLEAERNAKNKMLEDQIAANAGDEEKVQQLGEEKIQMQK
jgi:hypothetical protein